MNVWIVLDNRSDFTKVAEVFDTKHKAVRYVINKAKEYWREDDEILDKEEILDGFKRDLINIKTQGKISDFYSIVVKEMQR